MPSLFSGLVPTRLVPHRHAHPLFVYHLPLACDSCFPLRPWLVGSTPPLSPLSANTLHFSSHSAHTLYSLGFFVCFSHAPSISLLPLFVWPSCWCLHPPTSASLVGWHAIVWIAGGTWISSLVVSIRGGAPPWARPTKHETNRPSCCGMAPPPPQPPPSSGAGAARIANEDAWMEKTTWERKRKR